jgi:hypothetical protein
MLGTVTALRRYPVKSMLGEDLHASDVSRGGLARDRRLAVVSRRTGKVASAKYPRLWRDLLTLSAEALEDPALRDAVRITLPGGKTVYSTDADVDEVLSALLDEPVTLAATPPRGASLDRAVPEAVLRDEITAEVPAELIEIGRAPRRAPSSTSRRRTCSPPRRSAGSLSSAPTSGPTWSATGPTSSSARRVRASPRTTGSAGTCASEANSCCA